MAAVARSCPQPIERHILVPVRRKYQYVRMREMLAGALKPSGQSLYPSDTGGATASNSLNGIFDTQGGAGGAGQRQMGVVGGGQAQNRGFPLQTTQRKGSVNVSG